MREIDLVTEEIYHICNRSVEGIDIFTVPKYVEYFLDGLLISNTTLEMERNWRRKTLKNQILDADHKNLVEFLALSIMPNHIHLLVKQLVDNGIQKLMHRNCDGFAKFFNTSNNRKGRLFMGPYRAVHVSTDEHAAHLFVYIHGNILDLSFPEWRTGQIKDWRGAKKVLENYRWSSLPVFLNNSSAHPTIRSIVNTEFAKNYCSMPQEHLEAIRQFAKEDLGDLNDLFIE